MFKNKNVFRAGFTLIELLVVIAIIGILSSVILISLNVARDKASDAKVKAQITGAKNAAEVFFDTNKSYNGLAGNVSNDCNALDSMFQDVDSGMVQYTNLANYPTYVTELRCSSADDTFVISAPLKEEGHFWCVDSSGAATELSASDHESAHPDDATVCPTP